MSEERYNQETAMIFCDNLVKIYQVAEHDVVALQGLDLVVQTGELMGIVGVSGSGKTTLLNIHCRRCGRGVQGIPELDTTHFPACS